MSRYSDLRWKIVDLEKELEEKKIYSKKLFDEINSLILQNCALQKDKDELYEMLRAKKAGDNNV